MPKPTKNSKKQLDPLDAALAKRGEPIVPLWRGPCEEGVTQSLLSRFLVCRERFRLRVVHGVGPLECFDKTLEYGNYWHECEEALAMGVSWKDRLRAKLDKYLQKFRGEQKEVVKWYRVCEVQFPIYIDYWKDHDDVKKRKPLYQEEVFKVPYKLPSGRVVFLKGKFDAVDVISRQLWLQENKTKGDVDKLKITRDLRFDIQTGLYMVALREKEGKTPAGVRYNVVKRPLSGGKGSIVQLKPTKKNPQGESLEDYYKRLGEKIKEYQDDYFMRFEVRFTEADLKRFEEWFLIPVLENLCDWWEWIEADPGNPFREGNRVHFVYPYGVWNPMLEGKHGELDSYLFDNSSSGLAKGLKLFPELEEE